jgi:hypothetical protein
MQFRQVTWLCRKKELFGGKPGLTRLPQLNHNYNEDSLRLCMFSLLSAGETRVLVEHVYAASSTLTAGK